VAHPDVNLFYRSNVFDGGKGRPLKGRLPVCLSRFLRRELAVRGEVGCAMDAVLVLWLMTFGLISGSRFSSYCDDSVSGWKQRSTPDQSGYGMGIDRFLV